MPVYITLTKKALTPHQKEQTARMITNVHCKITAAPSHYVTVMFFSGYRLNRGHKVMLLGTIRRGGTRTDAVVEELDLALKKGLENTMGFRSDQVGVEFLGVMSHWVYEGQQVLPEPGQEYASEPQ